MEGLREAVERLPSRESLGLKKSIQLYDLRKFPKALKSVNKVLESLPDHPESMCVKAIILQAMGNQEDAILLSKSALGKNLGNVMCWHTQGVLKQSERKNKEALKLIEQAYRLSPENSVIQRDLSLLQLQLRQFEAFRNTRLKSLLAKSAVCVNWVAYAVAEFLAGNNEKSVEVFDSLLRSLGAQLSHVETSEVLSFRSHVLASSGKFQEAVSYLHEHEQQIMDKVGLKETQARLYIRLEQYANAADAIYSLLEMNQECREYHQMLAIVSQASGIPLANVYVELTEKYPKSHLVQRIPLEFNSGEAFESLLVIYIANRIRKGIPSLHADLKSLYSDTGKAEIMARVIPEMLSKYRTEGKLLSNSLEKDDPSSELWLLYLLAGHYKTTKNYDLALDTIETAIKHTPTVPDLYVFKGRILKHKQEIGLAADSLEDARKLDLSDRYLNNKTAKYFLRNNNIEKAEELLGLFSREQGILNVHEMQNMWYELEVAEAHVRRQEWKQAAEEFGFVERQFSDIYEDQSDFHMYCFRKMTLMSYVKMLDFEDELYGQERYRRAATGLLRCYLADHTSIAASRAPDLALQLLSFHSSNEESLDLSLQVFTEAGKLLLVLKCLFKLKNIGGPFYERYKEMTKLYGECPAFDISSLHPSSRVVWTQLIETLR